MTNSLRWQRSDEALDIMEKAIRADEKNPVPMYQKANILMSLEKFDEALAVLEELNEYSPRESSVHALMGRIYKRRNMHDKAMLHFGIALDLKPSTADVTAIKVIASSICLTAFSVIVSNHSTCNIESFIHSLLLCSSILTTDLHRLPLRGYLYQMK